MTLSSPLFFYGRQGFRIYFIYNCYCHCIYYYYYAYTALKSYVVWVAIIRFRRKLQQKSPLAAFPWTHYWSYELDGVVELLSVHGRKPPKQPFAAGLCSVLPFSDVLLIIADRTRIHHLIHKILQRSEVCACACVSFVVQSVSVGLYSQPASQLPLS